MSNPVSREVREAYLAYTTGEYDRVLGLSASSCAPHRDSWRLDLLAAWAAHALGKTEVAETIVSRLRSSPVMSQSVLWHIDALTASIELDNGDYEAPLERLRRIRIDVARSSEHDLFGELCFAYGHLASRLGDLVEASSSYEDAVAAFRRSDNPAGIARSLVSLSLVLRKRGHLQGARDYLGVAKSLQTRIRSPRFEAIMYINASVLEYACGEFESAIKAATRALGISEKHGLASRRVRSYLARGRARTERHEFSAASEDLAKGLELATEYSLAREQALAHEFTGDLARQTGDWSVARKEWAEALKIGERIAPNGDASGEPLRRLAEAELHDGDHGAASSYGVRAFRVNRACGDRKEEASTLRVLGDIALARGRVVAARKAYEASVAMLSEMGARAELAVSEEALAKLGSRIEAAPRPARRLLDTPEDDVAFRIPAEGWSFISRDAKLLHQIALLREVAPTRGTVLLLGETGTGKELLARYLHEASGRSGAFIAANASAFPESLVESELFGHVRGAFTGAGSDRKGLFEAAQGGTFFLDEVGDLPGPMQAKLLRTLEERAIKKVGATATRKIDVRFVAATNRDLELAIKDGRFRQDLYYRLSVHVFDIPPLRERSRDVTLLVHHFIRRRAREWGKRVAGIGEDAEKALQSYGWPGNIRELDNEIQRALSLVQDGEELRLEHLSASVRAASGAETSPSLFKDVALMEKDRILTALSAARGNQARAAELLGMTRQALRYKILKHEIKVRKKS